MNDLEFMEVMKEDWWKELREEINKIQLLMYGLEHGWCPYETQEENQKYYDELLDKGYKLTQILVSGQNPNIIEPQYLVF